MVSRVMNIGILGTARVAFYALIQPARLLRHVNVVTVASRDLGRAQRFAALHGIPRAVSSYYSLLEQKDIEAVYVALPTALHHAWTVRALAFGKHVLCEKPLASNAMMAQEMVTAASRRNLVLQEGMHILFLDSIRRQRDLIMSGAFGRIVHIVCVCRSPNLEMIDNDFRLQYELGGGAALDFGCYAVACLTHIVAEDSPTVSNVRVERCAPQVDSWMEAKLRFPSDVTGIVECGFLGHYSRDWSVSVKCERGLIRLNESGLACLTPGKLVNESVPDTPTYVRQLDAFTKQVHGELSDALPLAHAITNARIVDAMYERAGLAPRIAWKESF